MDGGTLEPKQSHRLTRCRQWGVLAAGPQVAPPYISDVTSPGPSGQSLLKWQRVSAPQEKGRGWWQEERQETNLPLPGISCLFFTWLCRTACRIVGPLPGIEARAPAVKALGPNHWPSPCPASV